MTNKHLRLHMIISAASAIVTVALSIVLRDQYATQSAGQRAKLSSLHIGIAAFQMLGCLFAFRTQAHALQVDECVHPVAADKNGRKTVGLPRRVCW